MPVHGNSPTPGVDRSPVRVRVGIDAAVVANHSVCVRQVSADGAVSATRFQVPPTLAGLGRLGRRLADWGQPMVVADPTSMTWLGLAAAVTDAGGQFALVGERRIGRSATLVM